MQHRGIKLYKVYINDDPVLTLTYFTARLNWVDYMIEWVVCPWSGLYTCVWPLFSNIFYSETAWPINAKFHVEPPWEGGTKVYINGPGHMTKMAAMPIYGKNLKNHILQNHYSYYLEIGIQHQ